MLSLRMVPMLSRRKALELMYSWFKMRASNRKSPKGGKAREVTMLAGTLKLPDLLAEAICNSARMPSCGSGGRAEPPKSLSAPSCLATSLQIQHTITAIITSAMKEDLGSTVEESPAICLYWPDD